MEPAALMAAELYDDRASLIERELLGLPTIPDRRNRSSEAQKRVHAFFIADIPDIFPKDDLPSMEHPIFALRAGDRRVRTYEHNGVFVTVKPGPDGCATIHDKDVWIYCMSQLVEAINRGRKDVGRIVRFSAYDFLRSTGRGTDGRSYGRMVAALARLKGTTVETDIRTAGMRERTGFGLIESWRVVERETDGRMAAVEVVLPEWLWRSVRERRVLTISRRYFRLRRPMDRRIYELARKHCGHQSIWRVSMDTLHKKSGSMAAQREFRRLVKELVKSEGLPEYRITINASGDMVTISRREACCGSSMSSS